MRMKMRMKMRKFFNMYTIISPTSDHKRGRKEFWSERKAAPRKAV